MPKVVLADNRNVIQHDEGPLYTVSDDPSRMSRHVIVLNDIDRKSTRLNSSHSQISYAVFCLKKKKLSTYAEEAQGYRKSSTAIIDELRLDGPAPARSNLILSNAEPGAIVSERQPDPPCHIPA